MSTEPEDTTTESTIEVADTTAGEAKPAPAPQPESRQENRQFDPRRRLRELLSVPERDRSDAQWDEINELEIQLAPGNRIAPGQNPGSSDKPVGAPRSFQQKKHQPKGGGGGGGGGGGKRRPRPGGGAPKPQQ